MPVAAFREPRVVFPAAACMGQIRASRAVFLAAHARESSHHALRLDFIRHLHDFLAGDVRPCTDTAALLLHFSKRGALANEAGVVGRNDVIRAALGKIGAFLIRRLGYWVKFEIEVIRHGAEDGHTQHRQQLVQDRAELGFLFLRDHIVVVAQVAFPCGIHALRGAAKELCRRDAGSTRHVHHELLVRIGDATEGVLVALHIVPGIDDLEAHVRHEPILCLNGTIELRLDLLVRGRMILCDNH